MCVLENSFCVVAKCLFRHIRNKIVQTEIKGRVYLNGQSVGVYRKKKKIKKIFRFTSFYTKIR